jgi:hypothetical protein
MGQVRRISLLIRTTVAGRTQFSTECEHVRGIFAPVRVTEATSLANIEDLPIFPGWHICIHDWTL